MTWDDEGFLLSKNKYSENSIISEIFTENHGKVSGIIFGATSKKIKNYLQIGNKVYVNFYSKNENRIGHFKIEIQEPMAPFFFDDHQKLFCISSALSLIRILTAEDQKNSLIYDLIKKFYFLLKNDNWIKNYIFWELELFKVLGYDLNFNELVEKKIVNNEIQYISKSSANKKIVPNFLVEKSYKSENLKTLLSGLKLVGDYLDKTILKPNNLTHPLSRLQFINSIK